MRLTSPGWRRPPAPIAPRDILCRLELFDRLPDKEVDELARLMDFVTAKPRQLLERQDVPVTRWTIMVSGHAVVERDATPIGLLSTGDSWCEHSLLNGLRSAISVVALSPVTTLTLDRDAFMSLTNDHPEVAARLVARSATSPDRLARPVLNALVHMDRDTRRQPRTA